MTEKPAPGISTFNADDADGYERLMGRWSTRLASPFLEFAGFDADRTTLDVGCGTGSLAKVLSQHGAGAVTGVDLAEPYIARAAQRMPDDRFSFQVADACSLPFADDAFEQVASLLVLHFVPNTALALGEMIRVAAPGATVAAAVWDARGGMVFNRLFLDTAAAIDPVANVKRAQNYTRPLTRPGELGQAFRDAGLRDVREDTLTIRTDYSDFDDYWSSVDAGQGPTSAYLKATGPDMRKKVKEAVRRAYLDGEEDGPRSYACIAWAAAGIV